jgi:hypothetical protein
MVRATILCYNNCNKILTGFLAGAGEPKSEGTDDKEIKALEAKLGLGSSSSNKAESALKKLRK